jgi:GTPase-associated protein 1, N-terminal domain type 1
MVARLGVKLCMSAEAIMHQAVFGYRAGHNLLAASCQLSAESRRTLAVLTDASGPWPTSGFDCVFTGTPLPDMPYYALFCTWPAPEMPRPGCVWSHVFLIELADLAGLVDLAELREYFRRPSLVDETSLLEPLRFIAKHDKTGSVPLSLEKDVERFLEALYGTPERPFVTEAPDTGAYTDLVFAIWSQQWPRLRRNFRFSTGSFADRGRGGPAFDLQITNATNVRSWQRTDGRSLPETTNAAPTNKADVHNWIRPAIEDLITPGATAFRSFLHTYGADVDNPRSAFIGLSTAYAQLVSQPAADWTAQLRIIGEIFPNSSDALRLKEWLIAPQETLKTSVNLERAWATVSFLLSAREARAYKNLSFDHAGIAPFLWKEKRIEVLSLFKRLVRQPENPTAAAFVSAVAKSVQPLDLRFICDQQPELISLFVLHRPSLAYETETWQLPDYIQWRIHEALVGLSLESGDWGKILAAMFLTATGVAVRDTVERAGEYAIEGAFQWLKNTIANEFLPSQMWREALATPAAIRLGDPKPLAPDQLALCAWFVPPKAARQLLSASRQDVQQLAKKALDSLPPPLRVPTAFLMVTLGLRAEGPEGIRLITQGFFQVHDALASTQYSSELWSLLSSELPRSPMWKDWDRCEKLRRAVRERLKRHVEKDQLLEAAIDSRKRELAQKVFDDEIDDDSFID